MPGPVEIADEVREAFIQPPISHRCDDFIDRYEAVRASLRALTGAPNAALLTGSGTLANEVVAGGLEGPGEVLVSGEFAARIARRATRFEVPLRIVPGRWCTTLD